MASLNLDFLIATVNLNTEAHARAALALLKKNGCHFLERAGETSTPKQKTARPVFIAFYLEQQPKDLSKGFVFGSDPRSCDISLATNEDTGISANHFSIQIDWGSRNPVLTSLSSSDINTQILGDKTTRILSEKAWQILEPGTTTTVKLMSGLQLLISSPDRGDLQPAYNRRLQQYLRKFQNTVPELAQISLEDDEVTPLILYRCAGLGRREYCAIEKIKTGDLDYDAKVHTYYARCRPALDALSTAQEVAGANTQQPDHFRHNQECEGTTSLIRDKSKGGRPGGFYVVKDFQTKSSPPPFKHRLQEIRFLSHLNIEEMVDIITGDSVFMAVVDIFSQYTLHILLQEGRLDTEEAAIVLRQIFAALEYLHDKEWTHGNLDPRSIHVMSRKNLRIKLTDVALSDYVDLGKPDGYHEVYASQDYKDPNRCPADIWSAGVVALQLLHPDSLPIYDHLTPYLWAEKLQNFVRKRSNKCRNSATAFVRDVLKLEFKNRPTASEVLKHPWIVRNTGGFPNNSPQYNLYMLPLGWRHTIPEPPISFSKQGISSPSNCSNHLDSTPQTRHMSSEPSHHANFQSRLAPPSSIGHGNFTPGPYNTGVGSSHYSSLDGPNTPSRNVTNTFYHQNDNPISGTISNDGGFQDSNNPGSQAMLNLHPNSRDSWDDFDNEDGATVSQSSHGPANPLVSHPGISTPYNGPVAPRATGTLSTQWPWPGDEPFSRTRWAGLEGDTME